MSSLSPTQGRSLSLRPSQDTSPWTSRTVASSRAHYTGAQPCMHDRAGQLRRVRELYRDPHRGAEGKDAWVRNATWTYTSYLPDLPTWEAAGSFVLVADVDTFATVALGGSEVGTCSSALRSCYLPVLPESGPLGGKQMSIRIASAAAVADALSQVDPLLPSLQGPGMLPHYNWARKPAYHFGWDWGPALVPAGLPGRLELLWLPQGALLVERIFWRQRLLRCVGGSLRAPNGLWSCQSLDFELEPVVIARCLDPTQGCRGQVSFQGGLVQGSSNASVTLELPPGNSQRNASVALRLEGLRPQDLWWPWELGPPTTHLIKAFSPGAPAPLEYRVGLRTVSVMDLRLRCQLSADRLQSLPAAGGDGACPLAGRGGCGR